MTHPEDRLEERIEDTPQTVKPGSVLKAKREEYEWAIESVAQALHLSTISIRSLEADKYDELPGRTYVIGYWRSYARLLGIDLEETIEVNKPNLQVVQAKSSGINVSGVMPAGDSHKGLIWLALSALILAGLTFAWKNGVFDPKNIINVVQLQQQTELQDLSAVSVEDEAGVLRKVEKELISNLPTASQNAQLTTDSDSLDQSVTKGESALIVGANEQAAVARTTASANSATVASSAITTTEPSGDTPAASTGENTAVAAEAGGVSEVGGQKITSSADKNLLLMNLEKDSWLDVREKSNKRLIYRSGKAGEVIELRGNPPFYVYIGTPDGVKITYLNQNVPFKTHQSGLFARFKLGKELENL